MLVDLSFFHHELDVLEQANVFKWVSVHSNDVRKFPRLQGTEKVRFAEEVGSIAGGGLDGPHRRHSILDHERKLTGVDSMGADTRVRTERHLHAGANGLREVLALKLAQAAVVLEKIRWGCTFLTLVLNAFLVIDIHVEIRAVLPGESNAFIIDERGVLHRSDPRADRILDPLGSVRVGFDAQAEVASFVYRGLQLLGCELDRLRIASVGEHCARGENLNVIGAAMSELADFLPHFPGLLASP